ncbi:MiaB/RimO family radical SAM methylthiotransferase [Humisphaera borealis]|uniref:tRNA-2-methylthio-N(6)-dimethylallyladenosine synthase n=1 Tax=Humisphaera borealis TaxID=2807512 RepID=A0A7M2WUS6_9BACT|nr:radical SAM protein [Humisphaera borealis]QOV89278.1 radical SAM protein [Humisphaera borealis]
MAPRTFSIQTLGCRVNQYEAEQLAQLLRDRGLVSAGDAPADLRLVHTCSVTIQAAGKSRQTARRSTLSLPVLTGTSEPEPTEQANQPAATGQTARVILTGCWATSDPAAARAIPGVDAVITHHDDVASEIDRLLSAWASPADESHSVNPTIGHGANVGGDQIDGLRDDQNNSTYPRPDTSALPQQLAESEGNQKSFNRPTVSVTVNGKIDRRPTRRAGFASLPLLGQHQTGRQRALLKIQDGCDAHCTYCIIPQLRPTLWSKPIDDTVEEARRLVDSGHVELVLTGIFLGAYGHSTALRRRQNVATPAEATAHARSSGFDVGSGTDARSVRSPLANLVDALCTRVPGLRRLRLSSLEPGDLAGDLLSALKSHEQVVPHFHLPLQSGSDRLLRKMNRQYTRSDFLRMADEVREAFDRPALTTDVIAGFPGEDDAAFADTAQVVRDVGFIHVHAFHFSPRPRTAAARWQKDFIRGPVVGERIETLRAIADENSLAFRRSFVGETVELLVEHDAVASPSETLRHGRCERYFDVWFDDATAQPGDFVRACVDSVTKTRTTGSVLSPHPVLSGEQSTP